MGLLVLTSRWLHNTSLLDKLLDQLPEKTAQVIDEFKALIGDVSPPFHGAAGHDRSSVVRGYARRPCP